MCLLILRTYIYQLKNADHTSFITIILTFLYTSEKENWIKFPLIMFYNNVKASMSIYNLTISDSKKGNFGFIYTDLKLKFSWNVNSVINNVWERGKDDEVGKMMTSVFSCWVILSITWLAVSQVLAGGSWKSLSTIRFRRICE